MVIYRVIERSSPTTYHDVKESPASEIEVLRSGQATTIAGVGVENRVSR